jgi:hypothetical protein
MANRKESVTLELIDGGFSTKMAKNAAATGLLERALKSLDGTTINVHERISESATSVDRLGKSSRDTDRSINQLTGRLSLLADATAILGPGLIPISAVALPAVTGLAAQLGFATTGAVGFVVAVQGLGDALGALNTAHLEPTADNLAAAQLAMEKLSPAGQDLAQQIFALRDEWRQLRDVSQEALFPGLSSALDDLETRLPDFERILSNVNTAVGDMLAEGAESLASPRWDEFFTFIATDAPPAIASMGEALGNVAGAMARLWMAFDPLNDDFASWLVDSTASLERWAEGLAQTEGFEDFVAYIRENGPQVAETMGAVASAVLRIVEAAAPLGGPVLAALEGVSDAIATIAGSDAGPAIMATVTALALLRRGMALFERGSQVAWVQNVKGADGFTQKLGAARSPILRTTAAMGGLALASSGVADGMLGSNAATGALLGSLGGPWGAAVGGAVGLMMDLGQTVGGFEVDAQALTDTLDQQTGAITENTTAFAANELEKQGVLKSAQALGLSLSDVTQASLGNEAALARVTAELEAAKDGFYNADGSIAVSSNTLTEYGERSNKVKDAIGTMSGELETGQSRVRRMADATDTATNSLTRAETAAQDFADAVTRLNNVLERRATVRDYEAAVDDLAKSIKENGRNFDINTEKGRTNQAALDNVANTAIRLAENLKGAARQKVLTAAIEDLREAGKRFDIPKSETRKLIELLRDANAVRVKPDIDVNTGPAISSVNALESRLRAIKDEDVFINVRQIGSTTLGPQITPADGATVPGQRYPYGDKVHALLAPGEEVISNRYGQADRHRALLKDINANRLADGGTAGGIKRGVARFDDTAALQAAIDRLTMVAEDQTRAVEKSTAKTEMWAERMADAGKNTLSTLGLDLWDKSSSPWEQGAGSGALWSLTRANMGLENRISLQEQLAALGLSGDALSQLLTGTNADISGMIQRGEIGQYAALFTQYQSLSGAASSQAGQLAYGAQHAAAETDRKVQVAALQATERHTQRMERQLANMQAALAEIARNAPERTGAAVGSAIDRSVTGIYRDNKRRG